MKTLSSRFSLTAPEWIHIRKRCKVKRYTTIKLNKAIREKYVFLFFVLLKIIVFAFTCIYSFFKDRVYVVFV